MQTKDQQLAKQWEWAEKTITQMSTIVFMEMEISIATGSPVKKHKSIERIHTCIDSTTMSYKINIIS